MGYRASQKSVDGLRGPYLAIADTSAQQQGTTQPACSRTLAQPTPWYAVDLGSSSQVQGVRITLPAGTSLAYLLDMVVRVGDTEPQSDSSLALNKQCKPAAGNLGGNPSANTSSVTITCTGVGFLKGRYITIQKTSALPTPVKLCLCSVQPLLYTAAAPPPPPPPAGPITLPSLVPGANSAVNNGTCCLLSLPQGLPLDSFVNPGTNMPIFGGLSRELGCPNLAPADVASVLGGTVTGAAAEWMLGSSFTEACSRAVGPVEEDQQPYLITGFNIGPPGNSSGAMCTAMRPCDNKFLFGFSGEPLRPAARLGMPPAHSSPATPAHSTS